MYLTHGKCRAEPVCQCQQFLGPSPEYFSTDRHIMRLSDDISC